MKELLKKYDELKAAEAAATEAMEASEADLENEALDEAFDKAYEAEFEKFEEVTDAIVSLSKGKIDKKTAGLILRKKRSKFEDLIARVAI